MPKFTPHFLTTFINSVDSNGYTQRIQDLSITAQPNAVVFKFRTTQLTVPIIEIFSLVRDAKGKLIQATSNTITSRFDLVSAGLGVYYTDHKCRINGLTQETDFSYRVIAGNGALPQAVAIGTFKTGKRSASFTISEIHVSNDGDSSGSGEMEFAFGFYNESDERVKDGPMFAGDVSSGDTINPFHNGPVFEVEHAPDWMSVYAKGQDDDHFIFTPFHPWNHAPIKLPEQPSHAEDDDWVNADAFQSLQFSNEPGLHRVPFLLNSGSWGVYFTVTGWADLKVTAPSVSPVIPQSARSLQTKSDTRASGILIGLGKQVVVEHTDGRRSMLSLGPDGLLALRLPLQKFQRMHQWKIVQERGVDSATIIAADGGIHIFTISSGTVKYRFEYFKNDIENNLWHELGEGFQTPLKASVLADGTIALTALKQNGSLYGMFFNYDSRNNKWVKLGDRLSGRIITVAQKDYVEIFDLTPEGTILTSTWHPESAHELYWQPIDSKSFDYIFVEQEDGILHIIGVVSDRQVYHLSREYAQWSSRWTSLGSLDDLNMEAETVTEQELEEAFA